MQKRFETDYGYFSEDGLEYVIKKYNTPRPWINVISNGNYGLVISQLGGGFSWITHSNLNRLTRWQQDLVRDNWGKYLYLRDDETGQIWSPTVGPVMRKPAFYECRHGIGYSTFNSLQNEIEAAYRVFVPFGDDVEIWTLRLKNRSERARRISIFTYFEWCLGAAPDWHREFHKTFLETEFDEKTQVLLARKRLWEIRGIRGHWNVDWNRVAYFACSENVDGFESDKGTFLGNYSNLSGPAAVAAGKLNNTSGKWNDSIASLKKTVLLNPGEEKTIYFFLGAEKNKQKIDSILQKYRQPQNIEKAFKNLNGQWHEILTSTTIETPDDAMNLLGNIWLKYQAISCRLWGRAAYYQQSGAFGFRDQLQDSQIFLSIKPELTKKQILFHAAHQFKSGRVLHWWHPITDEGLDANMSDDLLWLPFVTIQYLKETADWDILKAKTPYYDQENSESILQHCLRAIDLVLNRLSKRGLPLILAGDWNDGLSGVGLDGKGESIWLAHFLFYVLTEIQPVLERENLVNKSADYQEASEKLRDAVNRFGWDGEWFRRASRDDGGLIGSRENQEGKIFLNPQIWCVIADDASAERKQKALESAEKMLKSDVGPMLLYPSYKKPDIFVGYLSRYAPGVRENGGVYTHAATWMIWAECLLGRSEEAFQIFRSICPIYNGLDPERYFAEPYVTPGNIDGKDSPFYGRGAWTWYTGSAVWYFRVILDFILGIQADYEGLRVSPCLPQSWKEVKVNRLFRGVIYTIHIKKTSGGAGEKELTVDGKKIKGNLIRPVKGKPAVEVLVTI